ncbi:MAG TPA: MBL fold metallo-hydrolase [Paludibacteraceae bacterium]|nr:MBL fold metallo-hydrolase [Paludibacteraceae bacterium]HOU68819.1 MBL fold metallo-hydrolase [Paludibacteraceae bacterium]HPH63462.1 MBL fold metallo-hydrolase [Paludibacteraceae bacterium]HQF50582.1 MBL fold metallo-hydrolase [Paludibacteraceae bacterium]
MDNLRFFSIASGSSGNCYYLGNSEYGILIDAGVGPRVIKKRLKEIGVEMNRIFAVFVTHDHFDHIKSVATLGEVYHLPIYSTAKVHRGIAFNCKVTEKLSPANKRLIENGQTVEVKDFKVTSFPLPHDSTDNTGYVVEYGDLTFTFATDLGKATDKLCSYIAKSDYLLLESNYDEDMLKNGKYPYMLKQRVASEHGHLSNAEASKAVSSFATNKLKQVFLCHLSKENNIPELALQKVSDGLKTKTEVTVLPRTTPLLVDLDR